MGSQQLAADILIPVSSSTVLAGRFVGRGLRRTLQRQRRHRSRWQLHRWRPRCASGLPRRQRLRWRDGAFVGKEAVLRSVGNADVALIDSLKPESYSGARPSRRAPHSTLSALRGPRPALSSSHLLTARAPSLSRYGRRGHIASAVNVPYARVVDPASGLFLGPREIRSAFVAAGLRPNEDARRWLLY